MAGITHEWNGTVLTITSDSGSSSCDLKGATGDTGIRGPQGPKGEKGNGIDSVNGKIGDVVLTYEDVGALPDTYIPPVTKVNSKTGEVTLTYEDVGALPDTYVAPVTSVNTKTGAVQLTYSDVNAAAANHTHTAADVGALAAGGTAADSSKLGGKSASEYALKTDTAPDSAKLGGKAPEYYLQPRNLLDNSDFRNPVNQRGQTTYNAQWQYTIDRWITASASTDGATSLDITDSGITITNTTGNIYFIQRVPKALIKSGNTYTLAYQKSDGTIVVTIATDFEEISGESYQIVYVIPSGTTIVWAALYEGSYTADTLPPYVPKGYAVELAECQRYYRRGVQGVTIGKLYTDGAIFSLDYPQMRITNPTITLLGIDSQGWGDVDINNYTIGWGADYGSKHFANFVSTVTADAGKTVVVKYESIADL